MEWAAREESLRRLLAARREWHKRRRILADSRAAFRRDRQAVEKAAQQVERILVEIESRQGWLPFDDSAASSGQPTAASSQPVGVPS